MTLTNIFQYPTQTYSKSAASPTYVLINKIKSSSPSAPSYDMTPQFHMSWISSWKGCRSFLDSEVTKVKTLRKIF